MNLIDGPALSFVRAETRTLASRFEHVVVMARPGAFDGVDGGPGGGGNVVILGSHDPIDADALAARPGSRPIASASSPDRRPWRSSSATRRSSATTTPRWTS